MSIDKNSTGLPEINVHKRTTKVNLWMIAAVLGFLTLTAAIAVRVSQKPAPSTVEPPPAAIVP